MKWIWPVTVAGRIALCLALCVAFAAGTFASYNSIMYQRAAVRASGDLNAIREAFVRPPFIMRPEAAFIDGIFCALVWYVIVMAVRALVIAPRGARSALPSPASA